ncbi:hypothetical protein [Streptomyces phaeoluteigriseus]
MGADVTVLSQSGSNREAAAALGADHYAVTGDGSAFTDLANTFDLILNTVSAPVFLPDHLGMPRLHGTMVTNVAGTDRTRRRPWWGRGRGCPGSRYGRITVRGEPCRTRARGVPPRPRPLRPPWA